MAQSSSESSSNIYCENFKYLQVISQYRRTSTTGFPWVSNSQTFLYYSSSNMSITVHVFPSHSWFSIWFPIIRLCLSKPWLPLSICLCLYNLQDASFVQVFPSFSDPRRVADFSVCLTFYLFGWDCNFQVLFIQN